MTDPASTPTPQWGDDEKDAAALALMQFWGKGGLTKTEKQAVDLIVDAVAPSIYRRGQTDALRQAADAARSIPDLNNRLIIAEWLDRRAAELERPTPGQETP